MMQSQMKLFDSRTSAACWSCDNAAAGQSCDHSHQEEAGALGAQLDLCLGREGEDRHPLLLISGHAPAQEATHTHTETHTDG